MHAAVIKEFGIRTFPISRDLVSARNSSSSDVLLCYITYAATVPLLLADVYASAYSELN